MKNFICVFAIVCLLAFCQIGTAVDYYELVPWTTLTNGFATQHYSVVVDGTTSYHTIALNSANEIVKITNLGGAQTRTTLLSPIDWINAAGSAANMTNFYGFSLVGDYLEFADSTTDCIWRVHKDTGAITKYVSKETIGTYVGIDPSTTALVTCQTGYNGEHYFRESRSNSILKTNGSNLLETVMTASDLALFTGSTTSGPTSGLDFDSGGNMYFGVSSGLYQWNPATSSGSQVLTTAEITAVGGGTSITFRDIFYAPDGNIYFFSGTTSGIMKFNPANPVGTLSQVLSGADLSAGPAGSTGVYQLTWYDGNLAFNMNSTKGLYYVPEPATLLLLAIGGAALRRKNGR